VADEPAFTFLDPGDLVDGELSLAVVRRIAPDASKGWVAAYEFEMRVPGAGRPAGRLNFRAQEHPLLDLYRGHIGYGVEPDRRGRHYAERAVRLLLPFIRRHGFSAIWITCSPGNRPSRRTCERLGAVLVEVVELPDTEEMWARGDREKCRYRLDL
jgi:tagatose 1,6-diphosphate aldolase